MVESSMNGVRSQATKVRTNFKQSIEEQESQSAYSVKQISLQTDKRHGIMQIIDILKYCDEKGTAYFALLMPRILSNLPAMYPSLSLFSLDPH
eukprot:1138063-Pelagomonas_calceolata.AAC.7